MIRRWLARYAAGEAERYQDALNDETYIPERWSFPYAMLRHNGWSDHDCGGWPLTHELWNSYNVFKDRDQPQYELAVTLEPSTWTVGPAWFRDHHTNSGIETDVKEVLLHVGPVIFSLTRTKMRSVQRQAPRVPMEDKPQGQVS